MNNMTTTKPGRGGPEARAKKDGKLAEFVREFQRILQADGSGGSQTEWQPFWKSMADVVQVACCVEKPIEGRWVLRSRRMRAVPERERQALTAIKIKEALSKAQQVAGICEELEIGPAETEPTLARLAIRFCKQIEGAPIHLTGAPPAEFEAMARFVETFINPNRKKTYEPIH